MYYRVFFDKIHIAASLIVKVIPILDAGICLYVLLGIRH